MNFHIFGKDTGVRCKRFDKFYFCFSWIWQAALINKEKRWNANDFEFQDGSDKGEIRERARSAKKVAAALPPSTSHSHLPTHQTVLPLNYWGFLHAILPCLKQLYWVSIFSFNRSSWGHHVPLDVQHLIFTQPWATVPLLITTNTFSK